jgi:hypothetical protein
VDRFIATFPRLPDKDLMICEEYGVAYQANRSHIVNYDAAYYDKCLAYEGLPIADRINASRIELVEKHFGCGAVLDTGIGSGEFIRRRENTYGRDVNPVAIEWLKRNDLWVDRPWEFDAYTYWDVLEHIEDPEQEFHCIGPGAYLFTSLPIMTDLWKIRESKHYRPGEHLYYWTEAGFVSWMGLHGFTLLETNDNETKAGRDSILSFAFRRG